MDDLLLRTKLEELIEQVGMRRLLSELIQVVHSSGSESYLVHLASDLSNAYDTYEARYNGNND